MAVYVTNLVINAGENFSQTLNLLNSTSNDSLDITGYTATSMIRKHAESSIKTADFTVGITSAARGVVTLSLGSSITSSIKEGRYVYDVLLTTPSNFKTIVAEGMVLVRSGITT